LVQSRYGSQGTPGGPAIDLYCSGWGGFAGVWWVKRTGPEVCP
jgi:hypothetical protein